MRLTKEEVAERAQTLGFRLDKIYAHHTGGWVLRRIGGSDFLVKGKNGGKGTSLIKINQRLDKIEADRARRSE